LNAVPLCPGALVVGDLLAPRISQVAQPAEYRVGDRLRLDPILALTYLVPHVGHLLVILVHGIRLLNRQCLATAGSGLDPIRRNTRE
jgi:hypothetical protein